MLRGYVPSPGFFFFRTWRVARPPATFLGATAETRDPLKEDLEEAKPATAGLTAAMDMVTAAIAEVCAWVMTRRLGESEEACGYGDGVTGMRPFIIGAMIRRETSVKKRSFEPVMRRDEDDAASDCDGEDRKRQGKKE